MDIKKFIYFFYTVSVEDTETIKGVVDLVRFLFKSITFNWYLYKTPLFRRKKSNLIPIENILDLAPLVDRVSTETARRKVNFTNIL